MVSRPARAFISGGGHGFGAVGCTDLFLGRFAAGFLFVGAAETLAIATICRFCGCGCGSTIVYPMKSGSRSGGGGPAVTAWLRPHASGCILMFRQMGCASHRSPIESRRLQVDEKESVKKHVSKEGYPTNK